MREPKNLRFLEALALAIALAALSACASNKDAIAQAEAKRRPGFTETKFVAEEGLIYGLPIVMNYAVVYNYFIDRSSGQWKAPFNEIYNEHRVYTYKDTSVVTPNSDTPYSMLALDLRAEPYVLSVPAVEKQRYYSVQLCDWNTFNYGYIGSRATGNDAGNYLVVGPDWQGSTPAGIRQVFRSSTQFTTIIYRTQLFNPQDMQNVERVQAGYKVQPLSSYLHQSPPPPAPPVDFPKIDKQLAKENLFEYLDFALQFAPPGQEEQDIRTKLAHIGIGPGKKFKLSDLSPEHKIEVGLGMRDGEDKVAEQVAALGRKINGWHVASAFGDRDFYHGDWLLRAAAAKAGIYGNDAVEAVYPSTKALADGSELDGSKHKYT